MTPNQVIAYNLRRARGLRCWTQDEATEHLEPHLGRRWSRVVYSQAERSITGRRVRQFDADEIAAFAETFRLPVAYFFTAPEDEAARDRLVSDPRVQSRSTPETELPPR